MKFKHIFCLCLASVISHAQSGLLSPRGISFPAFTTGSRPAANGVGIGTVLYNTTDNTHQYSNGSSWLNLSGTNTLPSGIANQTLRNNGSGWVADGLLQNNGTVVTVGYIPLGFTPWGVLNAQDNSGRLTSIYGQCSSGYGIWGNSQTGRGIYGNATTGSGVYGESVSGEGVYGKSTNNTAIYGESVYGEGVYGKSTNNTAIYGESTNSYGGIFQGRLRLKKNTLGDAGIFFENTIGNNVGYIGMYGDNQLMVWGNGVAIQHWNVDTYAICHATSPTICSDIRLKKDFRNLSNSLASINQLKGYHYYLRNEKNKNLQTGFIAQEIQKIFPELVQTDIDGYLSVDYTGLIPHLVEAVKELKAENEKLKMMNEESRASNNELSGRLGKLEEKLIQIEVLLQSKIGDK